YRRDAGSYAAEGVDARASARSMGERRSAAASGSAPRRASVAPQLDITAIPVRLSHIVQMTAAEKIRLVITVFVVGALFLGVIFLTAYGASMQRDINKVNAQSAAIDDDIDNLRLSIERGRNIKTIEQRATAELGMIYPAGTQLKYLAEMELAPTDMAQSIKEKAYGS
ncbi:MAG: hypothetical protein LBL63_04725, partial [Clostridiales Family XIII bacterium]|nr:hypothetical protein [Clostridiales Family XIII bacterium]